MKTRAPLKPPAYFLAALAAMIGLDRLVPLTRIFPSPWRYAGALPAALGLCMAVWATACFRKAATPARPFKRPVRLVSGGIYRYTRNPMYLGLALILAGAAIMLGSLAPFSVIPVFVWLIQSRFIKAEEAVLQEEFGEEYTQFRKTVRRWI